MRPLTPAEIRSSFVNCSRREARDATLPLDLADRSDADWERLDLLGWVDRKAPLRAYVVTLVEDRPVGIVLRAGEARMGSKRALCGWCEDVLATHEVAFYVARRGGAAGRAGNTIGTLVCADFACSANVRRRPTRIEAGDDPDGVVVARIAGLRERSARFVAAVLSTV
ncbi:MAG TPA: FBP domain-containing protein [Cellulomonas sp.]